MDQRMLRLAASRDDDPLCTVLSVLVSRDLAESARFPDEDVGLTPLTIQFAARLRELGRVCTIWEEEPDLIRGVLDGAWDTQGLAS